MHQLRRAVVREVRGAGLPRGPVRQPRHRTCRRSSTGSKYALRDMAADAVAVLDAVCRRTGPRHGPVDGRDDRAATRDRPRRPAAVAHVRDVARPASPSTARAHRKHSRRCSSSPPRTRDEYVDHQIALRRVYGSKPEWIDEQYLRARGGAGVRPLLLPRRGQRRQMQAIMRDGDRAAGLAHGDRPDARHARRPRHARSTRAAVAAPLS